MLHTKEYKSIHRQTNISSRRLPATFRAGRPAGQLTDVPPGRAEERAPIDRPPGETLTPGVTGRPSVVTDTSAPLSVTASRTITGLSWRARYFYYYAIYGGRSMLGMPGDDARASPHGAERNLGAVRLIFGKSERKSSSRMVFFGVDYIKYT